MSTVDEGALSGIEMDRNTRLSILRRAREIISNPANWARGALRNEETGGYCLLGACERAAYDLGFATEDPYNSFDDSTWGWTDEPLGYVLAKDLSLNTYAEERYQCLAFQVNDGRGYEKTLVFLDDYIVEVEQGRPREATT